MKEAFKEVDKTLKESKIDARYRYFLIFSFSGSTCVAVLMIKNKAFIANIGDSRCILITNNTCKQLTIDHKPSVLEEKVRIIGCGGVVSQAVISNGKRFGPKRVWMRDRTGPGLAMSRSIGDTAAKRIGVISDPGNSI